MRYSHLAVMMLGIAIIILHFHGLLTAPMNDVIWGISLSQDPLGDINFLHQFSHQFRLGCIGHDGMISFPFGEEVFYSINHFLTPSTLVALALVLLTGKAVLAFNIAIITIFFLNYVLSYLAFLSLHKNSLLATVPATLMTFSAYAYAHSWAHLGLMPLFYFPWFLVALVKFFATSLWRYALIAASVAALSLYSSPYYAYFILWIAVAVTVGHLLVNYRRYFSYRRLYILTASGVLGLVLITPYIYWNFLKDYGAFWQSAPNAANYGDSAAQMLSFSARPEDYVFPNVNNFLYGKIFAPLVTEQMPLRGAWSDEFPVYIGFLPALALAGIGISLLISSLRRRLFARQPELVASLLLIMACAFLISLPHQITVFGLVIPMPNAFFRHFLPFRSYSRFAIVFLMALAVLIAHLLATWNWRAVGAAALIFGCVFESMPSTKLYFASSEIPYIKFLRQRPEKVLMRFEQNFGLRLNIERVLTGKATINGTVNYNYGMTDLVLTDKLRRLNFGHLQQMGAELLIVNGKLNPVGVNATYLEKIYESNAEQVEIWKLLPGNDDQVGAVFRPLVEARGADACKIVPRSEAELIMKRLVAILQS